MIGKYGCVAEYVRRRGPETRVHIVPNFGGYAVVTSDGTLLEQFSVRADAVACSRAAFDSLLCSRPANNGET